MTVFVYLEYSNYSLAGAQVKKKKTGVKLLPNQIGLYELATLFGTKTHLCSCPERSLP